MNEGSNHKTVVVIPGDDAAPEAVYPTVDLLRKLGLEIDFTFPPEFTDPKSPKIILNNFLELFWLRKFLDPNYEFS